MPHSLEVLYEASGPSRLFLNLHQFSGGGVLQALCRCEFLVLDVLAVQELRTGVGGCRCQRQQCEGRPQTLAGVGR